MQQKYTAADVREKRINFKGLTEEQFLALQAHFHKLYPEDGYMNYEWDCSDISHRFYAAKNNPKDVCHGMFNHRYINGSDDVKSTLEITFEEFDFEAADFKVGDTVVCIDTNHDGLYKGKLYKVEEISDKYVGVKNEDGKVFSYLKWRFKPATDWIPWTGGDCPVPEGTLVDVRHRMGVDHFKTEAITGTYAKHWDHVGSSGDIVAYRVCKMEEEPKTEQTFAELLGEMSEEILKADREKTAAYFEKILEENFTPKSILLEAEELINGERAKDYGKVSDNFNNIAIGWNVIIDGKPVTARKVGLMMTWLKICRDVQNPKQDNLVDGAGYFGCIDKMSRE